MSVTYRKLAEGDLETFISMRITQLREEGATEKIDLVPARLFRPDARPDPGQAYQRRKAPYGGARRQQPPFAYSGCEQQSRQQDPFLQQEAVRNPFRAPPPV